MIKIFDTKKRKNALWWKAASNSKHNLAHDLPLSFWSNPDEGYIDFFIKKGGNPLSNIISKKEKGVLRNNYLNPIHEVARNNPNPKVLKKLIDYAGEIDFFETLTGQLPIGYSVAHERNGRPRQHFVDNAIILMEHGTNPFKVYTEFNSCTIHAVVTASKDYQFLLDACMDFKDALEMPFGGKVVPNQTPLTIAAGEGRLWACKNLLNHGADIEGVNGDLSPVTACISALGRPWITDFRYDNDLYECLEFLLENGARRDVKFPGIKRSTSGWLEEIFDNEMRAKVCSLF